MIHCREKQFRVSKAANREFCLQWISSIFWGSDLNSWFKYKARNKFDIWHQSDWSSKNWLSRKTIFREISSITLCWSTKNMERNFKIQNFTRVCNTKRKKCLTFCENQIGKRMIDCWENQFERNQQNTSISFYKVYRVQFLDLYLVSLFNN